MFTERFSWFARHVPRTFLAKTGLALCIGAMGGRSLLKKCDEQQAKHEFSVCASGAAPGAPRAPRM
eukprot:1694278-Pyramimonas_sp.AAC.1